jgi:hypothetical protein
MPMLQQRPPSADGLEGVLLPPPNAHSMLPPRLFQAHGAAAHTVGLRMCDCPAALTTLPCQPTPLESLGFARKGVRRMPPELITCTANNACSQGRAATWRAVLTTACLRVAQRPLLPPGAVPGLCACLLGPVQEGPKQALVQAMAAELMPGRAGSPAQSSGPALEQMQALHQLMPPLRVARAVIAQPGPPSHDAHSMSLPTTPTMQQALPLPPGPNGLACMVRHGRPAVCSTCDWARAFPSWAQQDDIPDRTTEHLQMPSPAPAVPASAARW